MKVNSEHALKKASTLQWDEKNEASKFNQPFERDDDFDGPSRHRTCTDIVWVVVLALFSLTAAVLSLYGFAVGDPRRLETGFDFRGQLCGVGDLKDFEYAFVLEPEVSPAATCLDGCPIVATASSVCLYDAAHEFEILTIPCYSSYTAKGFYNHYCLPSSPTARTALHPLLESSGFEVTRLLGDIRRGWTVLAAGVLTSIAVTALVLSCLQTSFSRTILSYTAATGTLALVVGLAFSLYEESVRVEEHYCEDFGPVVMPDCSSPEHYKGIAYTGMGLACLCSIAIVVQSRKVLRGRLALQLGVLPLADVLRLVFVPLAGLLISFGVLGLMVSSVVYLASCADVIEMSDSVLPGERRRELVFGQWQRVSCLLLVLVALWWTSLIAFWVEFVSASVAQSWFFEKDRKYVRSAFRKALRHALLHTGSLAYASVMLPLLLLPRNFLTAVKSIAKRLSLNRSRCYLKSCFCCLGFYESSLKYKVEQAIAHQALWGDCFETASRKSFFLLKRSESQPQQLLASCHFVIWLCELCVLLSAPVSVYYFILHRSSTFEGEPTKFITSGAWVAFTTGIFSWGLASVLRGYVRGSVHGVVLAYICEQEMFPGLQRAENRQLAQIIEELAQVNPAEVVAEESLKPTGFQLHGKSGSRKGRDNSRVDILKEPQASKNRKTLDSEVENSDDLNQTGIDFTEESEGRPWTPELKFKQKHKKTLDRSADESLPVDDTRPFASRLSVPKETDEDDEGPDFHPYRFLDLIKAPPEKPKPPPIRRVIPLANRTAVQRTQARWQQSQASWQSTQSAVGGVLTSALGTHTGASSQGQTMYGRAGAKSTSPPKRGKGKQAKPGKRMRVL